jgi:hypothetical protein
MNKYGFLIVIITLSLNACIQNDAPLTAVTENPVSEVKTTITSQQSLTSPAASRTFTAPVPSPEATAAHLIETQDPKIVPENRNPLTGLIVEKPKILERRPIAVKVQLFPRGARPPWGISLADIVYDYYQNNGVTRLTAIFYGNNAEQVGPVRSARLFDSNIVKMYQAVFVFGLADQRIYRRLQKGNFSDRLVVEKYGICPPLCRIDPEGYNHLVVDTEQLSDYVSANGISNERQDLEGPQFDPIPPEKGETAGEIVVRISHSAYSLWEYDPTKGRYLRSQDAVESLPGEERFSPLLDQLTGEQVTADNIVILLMPHKYAFTTKAGEGELFDIKYTGNGEAYAFRNGQMYELHWNTGDDNSILQLTYPDGTHYPFKPGNTWFHIIGKTSSVQAKKGGAWRFEFKVP